MPDFSFPIPLPFPGGPGDTHIPLNDLIDELLRRRATSTPTPASPPAEPTPDLPTLPQPTPVPSVQSLPTVSAESALLAQLPYSFAEVRQRSRSTRESRSLAASFAQAYGVPLNMRRARRMARNRRTMRAQEEDIFVPNAPPPGAIDPRRLPVPSSVPSPDDFQRAIDEEARRRATDEDVREAARNRRRGPTTPRGRVSRGGRVRPGVGMIFDPFEIAEDIGASIGEAVGGAIYEQTPEEAAEAARIEREVRERTAELDRRLDEPLGPIPHRRAPPATPRGIEAYGEVQKRAAGREMLPIPQPPATAAPAPRNRARRALQRIQNATRNPWAQLGVLGLGLIAPRRKKSPAPFASSIVMPDDLPDDLTDFNAGMLPFAAPVGFATQSAPQRGHCDCKPKRRGPKRRCLERAQVAWRSGRYKGKLAGTRCVRWE